MNPRFAYRESAVRGASPARQVVLLYEQMIHDLTRAAKAIERCDVESRTNEINHAITVIAFLQGTLNMEKGGQVAANLARFYNSLRTALIEAQAKASIQILTKQIACLLELREAWLEVEKNAASAPEAAGTPKLNARPQPQKRWQA